MTGGIIAAAPEAGLTLGRLALSSGEAIRAMVRAGLGISILPARYLPPDDPHLTAIDLVRPTPAGGSACSNRVPAPRDRVCSTA